MSDPNAPVPDPSNPQQQQQPPADTAALPAQPAPPGWAAPPSSPAPPGWAPAASAGAPSGPRRWWSETTSTGGGRAALALAAVLAVLLVVVGVGLSAALLFSHHRDLDERGPVMGSRSGSGQLVPPGQGKGNGKGNNGNGRGDGMGGKQQAPGQVAPRGQGSGNGLGTGVGRGAAAGLGAVLHGEFTTDLTGTPTVMVVQTGEVTAYTAGKSLTVKSTDGYEATYTLTGTAPVTARDGTTLATGVQVRVLAAKDGMKVTALTIG